MQNCKEERTRCGGAQKEGGAQSRRAGSAFQTGPACGISFTYYAELAEIEWDILRGKPPVSGGFPLVVKGRILRPAGEP